MHKICIFLRTICFLSFSHLTLLNYNNSIATAQTNEVTQSTNSSENKEISDSNGKESFLDSLVNQTIKYTKQAIEYSSEHLNTLTDEVKKQISNLDSKESSNINIEEKIYKLKSVVNNFSELKKQEQKASSFTLFSTSKKDYRVQINQALKELEPVLFDGEVIDYSERIHKAIERIKALNQEIAALIEKKHFANPDKLNTYEKKINARKKVIADIEKLINKLELNLIKKFHRLGVEISLSQIRVLTRRVDGDLLVRTLAVFDITKQISIKMSELMQSTKFEPEFTRKYYGVYVVMAEMTLYAQKIYVEKIEDIYLPALDRVESDIKEAIKFAEKGLSEQTNKTNKKILLENIKSNKFSNEVADLYRDILEKQLSHLKRSMKESRTNVTVAYSTYDTASISLNIVSLIDTTQDEFDKILKMQLPPIVPFSNKALENRFMEISNRIVLKN
jgi:hypothetical protein